MHKYKTFIYLFLSSMSVPMDAWWWCRNRRTHHVNNIGGIKVLSSHSGGAISCHFLMACSAPNYIVSPAGNGVSHAVTPLANGCNFIPTLKQCIIVHDPTAISVTSLMVDIHSSVDAATATFLARTCKKYTSTCMRTGQVIVLFPRECSSANLPLQR